MWAAGYISQLNKGSLVYLSFTWQQQTAEAAETVVEWNTDLELVAWRAFASGHRAFVFVELSEKTDAKAGKSL